MKPTDGSLDETLSPETIPRDAALSDTVAGGTVPDSRRDGTPGSVPNGYKLGDVIGRGGMGEVVLAEDLQFGRNVALKRMRGDKPSAEAVTRFLREARIQARLDHPAIVPVHNLGHDSIGRPYFTMKRLAGVTLETVIDRGASQQKLLRAFVDVCLAIEFAHARDVIHRDLKPSNIMLGDYGEVYVLDWGVARVVGEQDVLGVDGESQDGQTQVGAVLGTPGYMSPEQVRGEPVTAATDVYALGAILYEILTGMPAHPRGNAAFGSTLMGPPVSPLQRRPDRAIAPELDAACLLAMAEDPAARPSARELADRIQRYLDGDRDLERRRGLATEQLAIARAAVATGDPARRAEAMNAAGRALALDPESSDAASLVTQLMLEPPRELPSPLAKRLDDADLDLVVQQGRIAAFALSSYFLFVPLVIWAGVRDWTIFGASFGIVAIAMTGALVMAHYRIPQVVWAVVANTAVLMLLSRVFSPLVLVPGMAGGAAVSLIAFPTLIRRPWIVIAGMLSGFVVPLIFEATGLWTSTWELAGGKLVIAPTALALDGTPAAVLLVSANIVMVVVMAMFVRTLAAAQREGQRRLEIQAWHLGQLLPVEPPRPVVVREGCLI